MHQSARAVAQHLRCPRPLRRARAHCAASAPAPPLTDDTGASISGCDAIIVLSGGLTPDGSVPPWVDARLRLAGQAYAQLRVPVLLTGGGTPHKPPVTSPQGFVVHEAAAMALRLQHAHGVPFEALFKEVSSYDTVGNAWFSMLEHAAPAGWRRPLVITSAFHMPRTASAFRWVCGLEQAGWAGMQPRYLSAPDEGLAPEAAAARAAREAASLAAQEEKVGRYRTAAQFHAWLHREHKAYAVGRLGEWAAVGEVPDAALASY